MKCKYWIGLLLLLSACGDNGTADKNPAVSFVTDMGNFSVELYRGKAPITVQNFLNYADMGFYNDTIFHRVVPGFVIQGGGFSPGMKNKPPTEAAIQNEAANGLANEAGTIAMARTSEPHSATSQFFVNLKNNFALNHRSKEAGKWGYVVFGKVFEGMDVVQKIGRVKTTTRGGYSDVPVEEVMLKKVVNLNGVDLGIRETAKKYIHDYLAKALDKEKFMTRVKEQGALTVF